MSINIMILTFFRKTCLKSEERLKKKEIKALQPFLMWWWLHQFDLFYTTWRILDSTESHWVINGLSYGELDEKDNACRSNGSKDSQNEEQICVLQKRLYRLEHTSQLLCYGLIMFLEFSRLLFSAIGYFLFVLHKQESILLCESYVGSHLVAGIRKKYNIWKWFIKKIEIKKQEAFLIFFLWQYVAPKHLIKLDRFQTIVNIQKDSTIGDWISTTY